MRTRSLITAAAAACALLTGACSAGLTDVPDPSTILDPAQVETQNGAVSLYNAALDQFRLAYAGNYLAGDGSSYALISGLASDEYQTERIPWYHLRRVDASGPGNSEEPYAKMNVARLHIDQAMGALLKYGRTTPPAYLGRLHALRGYLYIMFGEMYCSGVPFSRAIYGGDIVLGGPTSTTQMFELAVTEFDSALTLATDSIGIRQLAYVGKARALVNLNRFTDAAAAASETNVPTTFQDLQKYDAARFPNYLAAGTSTDFISVVDGSVANHVGTNGLDYLDAGAVDPRVQWYMSSGFQPAPFPEKFKGGSTPIPLATGIEARLIEAEAKLQAHDYPGWANALNTLRQSAETFTIAPLPTDSTTLASETLQTSVMFRERAFWLYGTGHRLGDMRRMVRQYRRSVQQVFPIGVQPLLASPNNVFSDKPNLEPPMSEQVSNPNYHGCLNRDA